MKSLTIKIISISFSMILFIMCKSPTHIDKIVAKQNLDIILPAWITLPESSKHYISPVQKGFINRLNYKNGDTINKGDIIAYLFHPDYLRVQQEYLKLNNQLKYLRSELQRQGELTIENITSIKKAEKAQSEYYSIEGQVKALEKILYQLGYNPANIAKNGPIKYAALASPENGILAYKNIAKGMLLEPENQDIYIITNNLILLNCEIPFSALSNIEKNDKITFTKNNNEIIKEQINNKIQFRDHKILFQIQIENSEYHFTKGEILKARIKN